MSGVSVRCQRKLENKKRGGRLIKMSCCCCSCTPAAPLRHWRFLRGDADLIDRAKEQRRATVTPWDPSTAERILQPVVTGSTLVEYWSSRRTQCWPARKSSGLASSQGCGREREKKKRRCNHCLCSSIMIIYLEVCKRSPHAAAAASGLWHESQPEVIYISQHRLAPHWGDLGYVNLSLSKKSPPMSSSAAPVWGTRLAEPRQSALNSPRRSSQRSIKPLLCGDTATSAHM